MYLKKNAETHQLFIFPGWLQNTTQLIVVVKDKHSIIIPVAENRKLFKKQISAVNRIAPDVYVLSFPRDFEFTAGQVVAIDIVPYGLPRLYSIASGEKEDTIDILFDEKSDGRLTPALSKLNQGDSVYVSEPFGTFSTAVGEAWWIASGTGIAPFVSMTRSGLAADKRLIHGGRYDENFYFAGLLEKLMPGNYIRCCSQQADSLYYKGRLTHWLKNQETLPTNIKFYLCGSAEMVVEVRDLLISKAVPFQNIISETYF